MAKTIVPKHMAKWVVYVIAKYKENWNQALYEDKIADKLSAFNVFELWPSGRITWGSLSSKTDKYIPLHVFLQEVMK